MRNGKSPQFNARVDDGLMDRILAVLKERGVTKVQALDSLFRLVMDVDGPAQSMLLTPNERERKLVASVLNKAFNKRNEVGLAHPAISPKRFCSVGS